MDTENKVSFATIVATGEKPDGAIHAAHIGQGIATEFNATGKDIIILVGALVKEALELTRSEGGAHCSRPVCNRRNPRIGKCSQFPYGPRRTCARRQSGVCAGG